MATMTDTESSSAVTGDQKSPTTLDVLVAARKLIEKPENWCQGQFQNGDGARCSAGAIIDSLPDCEDQERQDLYSKVKAAFEGVVGTYTLTFNDASGRTHAEVLAAFDKAIEAERLVGLSDDRPDASLGGNPSWTKSYSPPKQSPTMADDITLHNLQARWLELAVFAAEQRVGPTTISLDPSVSEIIEMKKLLYAFAEKVDDVLAAQGEYIAANVPCSFDQSYFCKTMFGAIDGMATSEIDDAAQAVRENYAMAAE